jgi:hypothetical protein
MFDSFPIHTKSEIKALTDAGGVRVPNYTAPTEETNNAVKKLMGALFHKKKNDMLEAMRELRMRGHRFKDKSYVLLVPEDKNGPMYTCLFWRFGDVEDLVIQAPHEGPDGTRYASLDIFLNTRAQALIFNYSHPKSIPKVGSAKSPSDMAHNWNNTFLTACVALYNLRPTSVAVQVHGMRGGPKMHVLMVNLFNAKYRHNGFAEMVAYAMSKHFTPEEQAGLAIASRTLTFPNSFNIQQSAHNTTTTGRVLNRTSDSGRFIHLELDSTFRANNGPAILRRMKIIASLIDALVWRKQFLATGTWPLLKASALPPVASEEPTPVTEEPVVIADPVEDENDEHDDLPVDDDDGDEEEPIEEKPHPSNNPTLETLDALFDYHAHTEETGRKYGALTEAAKAFAKTILESCPDCADRSAAVHTVREACWIAGAAIALDPNQ